MWKTLLFSILLGNFSVLAKARLERMNFVLQMKTVVCDVTKKEKRARNK